MARLRTPPWPTPTQTQGRPAGASMSPVAVATRDKRRCCRNCSAWFFARAASDHMVTDLGVASFCSNDCLWSFSIRAEDGC